MGDISSKVALDLNHVRIRGLGMGGRGRGERERIIQTYSKREQKLVVCLAKQMLLFLVSVKVCVPESCIRSREVSAFPFGYVPLEFDGGLFGAVPRQRGAGGWGGRLLACPARGLAAAGCGSS